MDESTIDLLSLGKGTRVTSSDVLELTHQAASNHLALPSFAGEREPRQSHIQTLLHHMERGTFHPEWVQLISAKCRESCRDVSGDSRPPDTIWRMNGQHTCHARLLASESYKCRVQVIRYVCQTEYDMRMLYASIDRNRPRGRKHIYRSYLAGTDQFADFNQRILERVPSGLSHWLFGDTSFRAGRGRDADEIAYLMQSDYYDLTCKVMGFIASHQDGDSLWILRSGVVAAIYATFDKDYEKAREFWESVVTSTGFKSTSDPRNRLHKAMLSAASESRGKGFDSVSREVQYRWCIMAWNAYREGREIKVFRTPDKRLQPK